MYPTRLILIFTLLMLFFILTISCGSGNGDDANPLTPPEISDSRQPTGMNRLSLGYYEVVIDLQAETIEATPLRQTEFHLNVLPFLEPPAFGNLDIDFDTLVIDIPNAKVEVDVILKHPFSSNPEFMGFDVKGIVITDGGLSGFSDPGVAIPDYDEPRLLNADGYSRWWNPREFANGGGLFSYNDGLLGGKDSQWNFNATVNGYKVFTDGLSAQEDYFDTNPYLRGRFSPGAINRRHYIIGFGTDPGNFLVFNYAIDANWAPPLIYPPMSPDDFPISANQLEAIAISVQELENRLYNSPSSGESGGYLDFKIDIFDWQGQESTAAVRIEAPELFDGTVFATPDPNIQPEDVVFSYYGRIEGAPDNPTAVQVLVMVEDRLSGFTQGGMNEYSGPDGELLAAYFVHTANVSQNTPPDVGPVTGEANPLAGVEYTYSVTATDFEDPPYELEYDWEIGDDAPPKYDDGSGNGDGTIDITFLQNGTFVLDVKVTDTDGGWNTSSQPLEVNVTLPLAPDNVGNVSLTVNRNAFGIIDTLTLDWDDVPGANEYVIYKTNDPYTPGAFQEIATVTASTFTEDPLAKHAAYLYTVRGRSVPGNPSTESGDSEYAFVEFETAEPQDPYPWTEGSHTGPGFNDRFDRVSGAGAQAGGWGWRMDVNNTSIRSYAWSVIASPVVPAIADASVYRIEFLREHPNAYNYHGLSVGTTDAIFSSADYTFPNFDISMNLAEGTPYTGTSPGSVGARFVESSGNSGAWWNFESQPTFSAFNLPQLPTDKRAAFGYGANFYNRTARVQLDEIAVIIY